MNDALGICGLCGRDPQILEAEVEELRQFRADVLTLIFYTDVPDSVKTHRIAEMLGNFAKQSLEGE